VVVVVKLRNTAPVTSARSPRSTCRRQLQRAANLLYLTPPCQRPANPTPTYSSYSSDAPCRRSTLLLDTPSLVHAAPNSTQHRQNEPRVVGSLRATPTATARDGQMHAWRILTTHRVYHSPNTTTLTADPPDTTTSSSSSSSVTLVWESRASCCASPTTHTQRATSPPSASTLCVSRLLCPATLTHGRKSGPSSSTARR
jgi:hypothetical protein